MAKVMSFSIDAETSDALAKLESELNFRNRSDAIRAAVRSLTEEIEDLSQLTGIITSVAVIVHPDSSDAELDKLKHQFQDIVITQVHNYFAGKCIEVFVLNGSAKRIAAFAKELKTKPKFTYAKLVNPHSTHKHKL